MNTDTERYPSFRWIVLAAAWLAMVGVGWILFLTPSLAYVLVPDLDLTPTQLTLIFTAPIMMAAIFSIPGGALGDRFGIKPMVSIAVILAGLSTLARYWVSGFGEMFALSCILGIGLGIVGPNLPKLVAVWFPPRETGLASGIYMTAFMVGTGIGLVTGPYFGSWKSAFLCTGIITTTLAFVWLLFGKSVPKGVKIEMPSIADGIKVAIKSKNIWLLSLLLVMFNGAFLGLSGNLPEALTGIRNISPKEAGAMTSLLTFAGIPGSILIPIMSDKVGLRKPFIFAGVIIGATCLYFTWQLAPGPAAYILIIIGGFVFGCIGPLCFTFPIEWREIGQEYVGGASGVVTALANAGGFLIPLLLITPIMTARTSASYNIGFLTITLLFGVVALVIILLTETGARKRSAI